MKVLIISAFALALNVPTGALAQDVSDRYSYADRECGNEQWYENGYSDYSSCYSAALAFYDSYGGGGSGGDGGGGGGGGHFATDPGPLPYNPFGDNCTARSRLCNGGTVD